MKRYILCSLSGTKSPIQLLLWILLVLCPGQVCVISLLHQSLHSQNTKFILEIFYSKLYIPYIYNTEWSLMSEQPSYPQCGSGGCLTGLCCLYSILYVYCIVCLCNVVVQTKVKPVWLVIFAPMVTLVSSVWSLSLLYPVNMQPPGTSAASSSGLSAVLFLCVCGAALPISSRPACPIDQWRREESSFMALQGLFQMQRPSLSSCVFSEKSRASGGLTVSPGLFIIKKKPSLSSTPLSLIFMVLGMHLEAAGTPGGWRRALLIPPFSFFLHFAFLPKSFFSPFLPKTGLRGTFLHKAARTVLFLFTPRPRPSCMFGKTMQVPPTSLWVLERKGSPAVPQLFEKMVPLRKRERCGSVEKLTVCCLDARPE